MTTPITIVREVYDYNLLSEFKLIHQCITKFPFASLDTEFPGTVYSSGGPHHRLSPSDFYAVMKRNVDVLNIIQIGLTLSGARGDLPSFGHHRFRFVWQFNFRGFDRDTDPHDRASIALLERQGIDFAKNSKIGIAPRDFAYLFRASGLGPNSAWITFHGPYDFGYLIKVLTGRELPGDVEGFMWLVRGFFGPLVYDVKSMIRGFGLHGGLDRVAKSLGLGRAVGKSHQAGSDSLLTMDVFWALMGRCLDWELKSCVMSEYNYVVYGLTSNGRGFKEVFVN